LIPVSESRLNKSLQSFYRFLPVQLLLLHGRKYQLLLLFWVIIILTIQGRFAAHFGADTLFLAPEYFGQINFVSMMLLGAAMGIFIMSWHITTFIIHSKRMPFIGATRQTFLKYCINNSLLPLGFFIFYSYQSARFLHTEESTGWGQIVKMQLGFYLGVIFMIFLSFAYFFRVGRDLLKTVLSRITNPAPLREIIPYDGLDFEFDMIQADTYLSETLKLEHIAHLEKYHPRLLNTVLRRHHRNAISATVFALLLLLLLGIFMEEPLLRIPAGAGFLILFAVMMGIVGAVKYFLKSWEIIGWALFGVLLSWLVAHHVFDLRSIAYGLNYHTDKKEIPAYNYDQLKIVFNRQQYEQDKALGLARLEAWKAQQKDSLPPLVIITVSGGGTRSAFWTFRALQYADSLTGGELFRRNALLTGASGGMLGAAFWRSIHQWAAQGKLQDPYSPRFQYAIAKDLLNAIIFSFAAVDLINPFNKISIAGYTYTKDRGYAMEQDMIHNTGGVLGSRLGDFSEDEQNGKIPQMIINSTIINDGRKLMMAALPVSYLAQPIYSLKDTVHPVIDAVDFAEFFKKQDPYNIRLATALRMNATFPFILPVVKLPSEPIMNVLDAGLRDNFGVELASRWMYVYRDWLLKNTREVIWMEIRDTREYDVLPSTPQENLSSMLTQPLFIIQTKWEPFQSNGQTYLKDLMAEALPGHFRVVKLQYVSRKPDKIAKLNFHLTQQEMEDLESAIYYNANQSSFDTLLNVLKPH
jgi:hypothetical protein